MKHDHHITLIIPTLNEAGAIGRVLESIPAWVDDIIVADNDSTDGTREIARRAAVRVAHTRRRGYGSACLGALKLIDRTDVLVFMDGDHSCDAGEMERLVLPIVDNGVDVVIGSRVLGQIDDGAMTRIQQLGNAFACLLIRKLWDHSTTDLGPFRAIHYQRFLSLDMRDPDYGWTVELQLKALEARMQVVEVPVRCRRRIGKSKISGTVSGVAGAGRKIIGLILTHSRTRRR